MKDTQILSAFQELGPSPAKPEPPVALDACSMGVVLRAVLLVEIALAVGVMFVARGPVDWLFRLALATGGALPATLLWLLLGCAGKRWLVRWPVPVQASVLVVLGTMAGLYGCGALVWAGSLSDPPWVASGVAGAFFSALLLLLLAMRAKGRLPADTAARLAELQSRIRPHFLFNTLNSAIALVRAEPEKAEMLLEDLSDLFRHALADDTPWVTLAEEISVAQRYLAIESIRFGDRLRVQWQLDPQADLAKLPPLLLQPLVENAIVHGVEPSASGAELTISTQRRGSVVVIKVNNTVPGGSGGKGHGLALANVRERLALLHDVEGRFACGLRDGVYRVRMEVPV